MDVPAGQTVYTCMLNSLGRIEADLTVSVLGEEAHRNVHEGLNPGKVGKLLT